MSGGYGNFEVKALLAVAAGWLLIAAIALAVLWPNGPQTTGQWVLLIVAGPPLYLLGEAFLGWLFSPEHGRKISSARFSIDRVGLAFIVTGTLLGLALGLGLVLDQWSSTPQPPNQPLR